jgi:hypothetical protein
MAVLSRLGWPVWLLIGAVIAVGLGAGVFFLVRTGGDGEQSAAVVATITAASPTAVQPAATPTLAPQPTDVPTQPPATEAPPTVEATPDTRVAIRDLPTRDQIQLGPDGKYFIADRGDGCVWHERLRETDPDIGLEVILGTDCPADFGITFRPNSGEVFILMS